MIESRYIKEIRRAESSRTLCDFSSRPTYNDFKCTLYSTFSDYRLWMSLPTAHDNAPACKYRAMKATQRTMQRSFKILPHQPNLPDLAASNSSLSPIKIKQKTFLKGKCFLCARDTTIKLRTGLSQNHGLNVLQKCFL